MRQLEVLGPELCSLLVPPVSPTRSDLTRPPDTGQGRSSTQPWFRVGRRLGFHSWAGALLTHCFCSSAGKPRLPGALDPHTGGLIWPPSWVGLSFSTLGRSPRKGASAWLPSPVFASARALFCGTSGLLGLAGHRRVDHFNSCLEGISWVF